MRYFLPLKSHGQPPIDAISMGCRGAWRRYKPERADHGVTAFAGSTTETPRTLQSEPDISRHTKRKAKVPRVRLFRGTGTSVRAAAAAYRSFSSTMHQPYRTAGPKSHDAIVTPRRCLEATIFRAIIGCSQSITQSLVVRDPSCTLPMRSRHAVTRAADLPAGDLDEAHDGRAPQGKACKWGG